MLDTGALIYQWNGKYSSRKEKAAALEMSTKIKAERTGGQSAGNPHNNLRPQSEATIVT